MAEQRQKSGSVLLRIGSKDRKGRVLEIYRAELWPDEPEADAGLYRVRINDRWLCIGGRQFTFFTPEGLADLLAQELTAPGALEALARPAPALTRGAWVRYTGPDYVTARTRLMSDPVLWLDGQWRAWVNVFPHGPLLVCCDELTPVDHFGREVAR